MSTPIGREQIAVEQADLNEEYKGGWKLLYNLMSRIKRGLSGLLNRVKTSLTTFKNFVLHRKNVYSERPGNTAPGDTDNDIKLRMQMRSRLLTAMDKLRPLREPELDVGDPLNYDVVLFESGVEDIYKTFTSERAMSKIVVDLHSKLLKEVSGALSVHAIKMPTAPVSQKMLSRMIELERVVDLLEMAVQARKEGRPIDAMYHEIVFLASMVSICLEDVQDIHARDIESTAQKRCEGTSHIKQPCDLMMDVMVDLKKGLALYDDADREKIGIPYNIKCKCEELFEFIDMFSKKQLYLQKLVQYEDGYVDENDEFEIAFFERHPEWKMIGSEGLFVRLLEANADCFALKKMTNLPMFREYVESLDRAKDLFFNAGKQDEAFELVERVLNKAFNIKKPI